MRGSDLTSTYRSDVIMCAAVVCASVLAALGYAFLPGELARVTHEDGLFENSSVAAYLGAALLLFFVAATRARANLWIWAVALLFFVVAGEEISWGQRLFSVHTPEALRSVNVQGEMNIHNIEGIHGSIRAVSLLIVWGLFVAVPVGSLIRPFARWIRFLRLPVAPWWSALSVVAGTAFMAIPRLNGQIVFELDEVGELLFSLAALGLAIRTWMTLRSGEETKHACVWRLSGRAPKSLWRP